MNKKIALLSSLVLGLSLSIVAHSDDFLKQAKAKMPSAASMGDSLKDCVKTAGIKNNKPTADQKAALKKCLQDKQVKSPTDKTAEVPTSVPKVNDKTPAGPGGAPKKGETSDGDAD